jgi:hypothetical protein
MPEANRPISADSVFALVNDGRQEVPEFDVRYVKRYVGINKQTDATFTLVIPGWGKLPGWRVMRRKDNNAQFVAPPSSKIGATFVPFMVLEPHVSEAVLNRVLQDL